MRTARSIVAVTPHAAFAEDASALPHIFITRDGRILKTGLKTDPFGAMEPELRIHQYPKLAPGEVGDFALRLFEKQSCPALDAVPNLLAAATTSHQLPIRRVPKNQKQGRQRDKNRA